MKRGVSLRPAQDSDIRVIFASYKAQGFPKFPDDLDAGQFRDALIRALHNAEVYIAEGHGPEHVAEKLGAHKSRVPFGIIMAFPDSHRMSMHYYWFPWSSPRNRLEASAKFVVEMRKTHTVVSTVAMDDRWLPEHLVKYGIVRRVGKIKQYGDNGNDVMMYQSTPL